MAITVHTAGVHYRWTDNPPEQLMRQLRLAHDLREDLVTLQLDYETAKAGIWSSYPAVAAAETELADAESAAEQAAAAVSEERTKLRTKRITGPLAQKLTAARKRVREARSTRRAAISEVHEEAKGRLVDASDALKAQQKALYKTYCQDGDLFWATFNDVLDHHKAAVKRIGQMRAAGQPAQLRHHRFDGTGSIAVQLQRQAGQPQRTPELIADVDGKYGRVLSVPWVQPDRWERIPRRERRMIGRVTVRMRAGQLSGEPQWLDIPVQQHRMLPLDADITGARLTVTRTAGTLRAQISVTAKIPDPEPVTDGPDVAVHLGWRNTDTGVRVARWRSTEPIEVPFDFRDTLTVDPGGRSGEIFVPEAVPRRVERAHLIASHRADRMNELRARLVDYLAETGPRPHPSREGEELGAGNVRMWKSPNRFAWLARVWADDESVSTDIREALAQWRHQDWISWHHQEGGRRRSAAQRLDVYRQVAAVLVSQAGRLVLDDTSYADIAQRSATTKTEELPNETAARINRRRAHAAPGELRQTLVAAADRDAVPVDTVSHTGVSVVHAKCGHENPSDGRFMSVVVACDGCGEKYDQDESALTHMLTRAVQSAA
ncbi:hypothetical protein ACT17_05930 [Mycolicibacterium conceptionense]|uniref:Uncharacterized protein n=1 Tax=Mycolicibacterium conceptionense TaxID=451644 RepID=A0A0J8X2A2_9MYCO|nr:hypothetical protein [Mycolicibacterium conceptionense]KMV19589.1 hypothetical protein ACT17_05930 [Mycolicibacterium conceptionense]